MMKALLDPIGFIADSIAIANALGIQTPAQQEQTKKLTKLIEGGQHSTELLTTKLEARTRRINEMITTSTVIEVRSRLQNINDIPSERIEVLIKLLFLIKQTAYNVVFAIIAKYQVGRTVATLGFAGTSADAIEELVQKVNDFYRGIRHVSKEITSYVTVRIRGKFDNFVENACASALTAIATDVCDLSRNIELANVRTCLLDASGTKTITLLQPENGDTPMPDCDRLRRTFLIGDTRSGKSTLGNALLQQKLFNTSKGMTGTMRIERGERHEEVEKELWVTEVYDTPGLNDKDGLDDLYQAAIEDQIRTLQRASALIMTVSVEAGITNSTSTSLAAYKKLFGDSVASMLVIVLTVNTQAGADELSHILNINWPTISAMDERIKKRNVFCVSLHDLRECQDTASHIVLEEILDSSRGMPMKLIEALQNKYQKMRESLVQTAEALECKMREIMDSGWLAYDSLADRFQSSQYVKLTDERDGLMDGFVLKGTSTTKKLLAYASIGLINTIRKTAIHVHCQDETSKRQWNKFVAKNRSQRHRSDLMKVFGETLYKQGLGVTVAEKRMIFVGTLRVRRYTVCVFNPLNQTHEKVRMKLQKLLEENSEESQDKLSQEVINDLANSTIPPAIHYTRFKKNIQKVGSILS